MTYQEAIDRQMKDCAENWFKDHKATILVSAPTDEPSSSTLVISWKNPSTTTYACRYIVHWRWLCVMGDIGEAIYEWPQLINLGWLAGLDFHYFFGKLRAADSKTYWQPRVAWSNLQEFSRTNENKKISHRLSELLGSSTRDEYMDAAREIFDMTGDGELSSMISTWGDIPHPRQIGAYVGLKMAFMQLTAHSIPITT